MSCRRRRTAGNPPPVWRGTCCSHIYCKSRLIQSQDSKAQSRSLTFSAAEIITTLCFAEYTSSSSVVFLLLLFSLHIPKAKTCTCRFCMCSHSHKMVSVNYSCLLHETVDSLCARHTWSSSHPSALFICMNLAWDLRLLSGACR